MAIPSLSIQERQNLGLNELVGRMDEILDADYDLGRPSFDSDELKQLHEKLRWQVSKIISSEMVKDRSEHTKRKLAHISFRFILQERYSKKYSDAVNQVVFQGSMGHEWSTIPTKQMQFVAYKQAQMISARICIEYLMRIIFLITTDEDLYKQKKSKISKFTDEVLANPDNPFHVFAHTFITVARLNGDRAQEIHANSALADSILQMDTYLFNNSKSMYVVVMNVWLPLMDVLNNRRVAVFMVHPDAKSPGLDKEFFSAYREQDRNELKKVLDDIAARIKNGA